MRLWLALALACALVGSAQAQQAPNPGADVAVAKPAYAAGKGPRVLVDEAHQNFHTVEGRYAPFGALLKNDGYRVEPSKGPFTADSLKGAGVLVIANANVPEGATSAFNDAEIAAVKAWVEGGGSLLLIADHKPFAGAAAKLAQAFGVSFNDAYAINLSQGAPGSGRADLFGRGSGLADHPVTRGRGGDPAITQVRTFTGSAFTAPAGQPLITLQPGFVLLQPEQAQGPIDPTKLPSAAGMLQGATLTVGKGRVAVMGEAAMFSSQLAGPEKRPMGFGAPGAEQNQRFALNLLHWLSRRPGY